MKALVEAATEAMKKHGYALLSAEHGTNRDLTALRFAVAGDDVMAERLKPIVLEFTGLEIMTMTDPSKLANAKVRDAMVINAMGTKP